MTRCCRAPVRTDHARRVETGGSRTYDRQERRPRALQEHGRRHPPPSSMTPRPRTTRSLRPAPATDRRARSRGQAIVEVALVLPVMLLILLAAGDLARVFGTQVSLDTAARAGAMEAAIHPTSYQDGQPCDASVNRVVCAVLTESTGAANPIAPDDISLTCTPSPCSEALGHVVTVRIDRHGPAAHAVPRADHRRPVGRGDLERHGADRGPAQHRGADARPDRRRPRRPRPPPPRRPRPPRRTRPRPPRRPRLPRPLRPPPRSARRRSPTSRSAHRSARRR